MIFVRNICVSSITFKAGYLSVFWSELAGIWCGHLLKPCQCWTNTWSWFNDFKFFVLLHWFYEWSLKPQRLSYTCIVIIGLWESGVGGTVPLDWFCHGDLLISLTFCVSTISLDRLLRFNWNFVCRLTCAWPRVDKVFVMVEFLLEIWMFQMFEFHLFTLKHIFHDNFKVIIFTQTIGAILPKLKAKFEDG